MIEKVITFKDFNGKERTETFYFNISKSELIDWQVNEGSGLDEEVKKLTKSENLKKSVEIFKKIIDYSVGEKSSDGRRFIKDNGRVAKEFKETNAYEVLYMELATDDKKAATFINSIFPKLTDEEKKNIEKKVEERKAQQANQQNNNN